MGTSAGNAARRRVWPGLLVIFFVVVVALGGLFVVYQLTKPSEQLGAQSPRLTPITTTAPPATTSPVVPAPPPLPHDFVAQAMPTGLEITCGGELLVAVSSLTTTGEKRTQSGNKVVITPDIVGDTVAVLSHRLAPWAVMPGSEAQTTTIVGHANYPQRMAFNPIAEYHGDTNDCKAVVTVPGSILTYGFEQSELTSKKWVSEAEMRSGRDNTLLVATCYNDTQTIFWEFTLVSSENVGS